MSNLDLARLPTQKLVPRGATAGVPFQPQPIVEFQDELNNPVDIEATVSVHFRQYDGELCEEDAPSEEPSRRNTVIRSRAGSSYFTDLRVDQSGTYRFLSKSRCLVRFQMSLKSFQDYQRRLHGCGML